MKNRFLAWLLVLCLMISISVGALAEEEPEVSAEQVEEEAREAESLELGGEEPLPEPEPEPEGALPPEEEAAAPLTEGYAAVIQEKNLLYDDSYAAVAEDLPVGTVLYVLALGEDGQAQVACGVNGEIVTLWMDALALRALEADAAADYIAAAADSPDVLWLDEARPVTALTPAASGPVLNVSEIELDVGETCALTAGEDVAWSVTDEAVASIDGDGIVTALATGETEAVATTEDGRAAACAIRVKALSKGVHFIASELVLGVGEKSYQLSAIFDDLNEVVPGKVTYSTSNKKYVTVTSAGVISA